MEPVKIARSFIAADSLAELIAREYELGEPISCKMFSKLLRTQDNDHYRVNAGDDTYVLRVYEQGDVFDRQEAHYLFEIDWLLFLKDNGINVSIPLQRRDGSWLGCLDAPEGRRYYALFTFAVGQTMSTSDADQLFRCGVEMAKIHEVSNQFSSSHERAPLDLTCLLDKPLERIEGSWGPRRARNLDILLASAEEARQEVYSLLGEGGETSYDGRWGVIGGDFHNVSVHFNGDQATFFNFDRCGYGWRAYDIAAFLSNTDLLQAPEGMSEAFFAGYYSVRPLSQEEHAAVSPFLTIRRIWRMGLFALNNRLAGYTFLAPA